MLERADALRARADRHIEVSVMGLHADPAAIEQCLNAGCRRVVHWIPSGNRSVVERGLERWESAIAEVTGEA